VKRMSAVRYLRRLFLTGLVVVVPIWATLLILYTLFVTLDNVLADLLGPVVRSTIPGLGVISLLALIVAAGWFATNFLGRRLVAASEAALLRIPVIRGVYTTFKSVAEIFSFFDRGRGNPVVLIPFPRDGLYALGLLMGDAPEELQRSPLGRLRTVFVPTAPHPFTGYLAFVLQQEIIPLSMGFQAAMRMQFSCGLYVPPVLIDRTQAS
jgi:uncharacterized membrane protein